MSTDHAVRTPEEETEGDAPGGGGHLQPAGEPDGLLKEALRASETKYRTLFDSIDEGLCLIEILFDEHGAGCDYRFIEANPAFEKQTGLRVADTLGRTMREVVPEHEVKWFEIYGRIALTGKPERFEQSAEALGRYFDVYAFRMGKPEERRVAVLFNDIAARKEAEAGMAADLHAMRTLSELGARIIPRADIQELYEEVNAAAMKLTGADAGTVQIFDSGSRELLLLATHGFPADAPERFGRVSAVSATSCGLALESGERTVVAFDDPALEDPKGDLRWHIEAGYFSAQSTPLLSRSGNPIGMLSTHWRARRRRPTERETRHLDLMARQAADLIEQRLAFEEIQAARLSAETATRAKDAFLAQLSHELRTPLSPVLLLSRTLAADESLPATVRADLETISRGIDLQSRLIDDMLDISRITTGKLSLVLGTTDIHDVLRHTLRIVGPDAVGRRIGITLDPAAPDHTVQADAVRVQQVFWNVLKNAVKFTPENGYIAVRTRNPAGAPDMIEIEISDTGIGIEPEMVGRVFDAFAQEDHGYRFGGLGLGLAISHRLVGMHQGRISVESGGRDQGSTFRIELPLAAASMNVELSPGSGPPRVESFPPRRILLVEDHEPTRTTLARLLTRRRHHVVEAGTLAAARECASANNLDLIISDIGLPDGDGHTLMSSLRDAYGLPGIALSGYGMEEDLARSRASGFFTHLVKPVDIRSLEAAIALAPC